MKNANQISLIIALLFLVACNRHDQKGLDEFSVNQQVRWNQYLTKVVIADIFTPPVASRIYAYANIAAYEAICPFNENYESLSGKLHDLALPPQPDPNKEYYYPLVGSIAFTTTSAPLVYDRGKVAEFERIYLEKIKDIGIDKTIYENSVAYGREIGKHIIDWASRDGYLERTAKARYILSDDEGAWKPTPPDYMPAIEPHWNTLRTFVIDSANQFNPGVPTDFDTDSSSTFYKEAIEVYEAVNNLDSEKIGIAKFWDCNPNISRTKGHLVFFDQKISPGGHWISIAGIAIQKETPTAEEAARIFALVSTTLADAFISCWDEKYRSSLIRPETYINQHIDNNWKPVLQTPAFPEYTSGHSVASAAAAVMLTSLMGDNFEFMDSTEVNFGLPVRHFNSFTEAADEAAISRLYGGIHYMPAIKNGVSQGKKVGNHIVDQLIKSP